MQPRLRPIGHGLPSIVRSPTRPSPPSPHRPIAPSPPRPLAPVDHQVDARLGKLILLGVAFHVTDEALTIAAALASRSPFLSPHERRAEADASRRAFAQTDDGRSLQSDHLAVLRAYQSFDAASAGGEARYAFARERFLGIKTLQSIGSLKRQLLEALSTAGLAPPGLRAGFIEETGRRAGGTDGVRAVLGSQPAPPPELLGTIILAALHPHLAYIAGAGTKQSAEHLKLLIREPTGDAVEPTQAWVHPSSVTAKLGGTDWRAPFVAFHECVRTTRLYVRDASPAPLLPLLCCCGASLVHAADGAGPSTVARGMELVLDGWLTAHVQPPRVVPLLVQMRARVEALMAELVDGGEGSHVPGGDVRVDAIVDALVALFQLQPLPEAGAAKKAKSKPKNGNGISKRVKKAAQEMKAGGAGRGGRGSFFDDPYNDVSGRGGLFDI